jgi:uncharacterized protein
MHKQIYLNIAVDDLERSKSFFAKLGFTFEPKFTDQNAACMIVGENIFTMLLTKPFFSNFTSKPLVDASKSTEALICLSCDSRGEVDSLVAKAIAAGGSAPREPQDYGFMYSHGFEDLDGHLWELAYMDPNVPMPDQTAESAAPDAR